MNFWSTLLMLAMALYVFTMPVISIAMIVSGIARLIAGGQNRFWLLVKVILTIVVWFVLSIVMLCVNVDHIMHELENLVPNRIRQLSIAFLNYIYTIVGLVVYFLVFRPVKWNIFY